MVNKLFKKDNMIYRVLKTRNNELLIIDCVKKTMPIWVDSGFLSDYTQSDEEITKEDLGIADISSLNKEQLRIMHNRFASISALLMKYEDETERKFLIEYWTRGSFPRRRFFSIKTGKYKEFNEKLTVFIESELGKKNSFKESFREDMTHLRNEWLDKQRQYDSTNWKLKHGVSHVAPTGEELKKPTHFTF